MSAFGTRNESIKSLTLTCFISHWGRGGRGGGPIAGHNVTAVRTADPTENITSNAADTKCPLTRFTDYCGPCRQTDTLLFHVMTRLCRRSGLTGRRRGWNKVLLQALFG
jgi:hypothetical protein